MSQDVILATVRILKNDPDMAALVDTRVHGGEVPKSAADAMPIKAILVRRAPGQGGLGGRIELERQVIDVLCYGETPFEADRVYRAAREALKQAQRQTVGDCLVHDYSPANSAMSLRDPDVHWPYVMSSWTLLASEVEA